MKVRRLSIIPALIIAGLSSVVSHAESVQTTLERKAAFEKILGDPIPTFFECTMRSGSGDECDHVEAEFFNKYQKYFKAVRSPDDAKIHLKLTDQNIGGSLVRYTFEWDAKEPFSVDYPPYSVEIDTGGVLESVLETQLRIAAFRGAFIFLSIASAEVNDKEMLVVDADTGISQPQKTGFFARLEKSPFSIDGNFSGNFSKNGPVQNSSYLSGNIEGDFSTDKYRVFAGYGLYSQSNTQPDENGSKISVSNSQTWSYFLAARSFGEKRRWSVALGLDQYANPGNNVKSALDANVGIEYTLVPFRVTQNKEFYFRIGTGIEKLDLELENDLGFRSMYIQSARASLSAYWAVFDSKVILSGTGRVSVFPKFTGYENYSGTGSVRYRFSRSFSANSNYSIGYRKKSFTYPANPDYSNPLQTQFLTSAPGITTQLSFGLTITLGNTARKSSDRRWKNN
jgi:hypothetical protein